MVNNVPLLVEFGLQGMITLDNLLYEAGEEDTAHKLQYMITRQPTAGMPVRKYENRLSRRGTKMLHFFPLEFLFRFCRIRLVIVLFAIWGHDRKHLSWNSQAWLIIWHKGCYTILKSFEYNTLAMGSNSVNEQPCSGYCYFIVNKSTIHQYNSEAH